MKGQRKLIRNLIGLVAMLALLAVPVGAFAQGADTVSGSAFGVSASGLINVAATPSVTLPATGGTETDSVAQVNAGAAGSTLTTGVLEVTTTGDVAAGTSSASATVNNLAVTLAGVPGDAVSATTVRSTSESACTNGAAQSTGNATIENLQVLGNNVTVTGAPNQTVNVDLPAGLGTLKVIINHHIGGDGDLTVHAIHVMATVGGVDQEVIVAAAHSDINCAAAGDTGGAPNQGGGNQQGGNTQTGGSGQTGGGNQQGGNAQTGGGNQQGGNTQTGGGNNQQGGTGQTGQTPSQMPSTGAGGMATGVPYGSIFSLLAGLGAVVVGFFRR